MTASIRKMLAEKKSLVDDGLREREMRRLAEVKAAFFEGMEAGYDRSWMERPAEDYWLESDARRTLYAGPPLPNEPIKRLRAGRHRRGYRYSRERDPGQVVGESFR